VWRELTCVSKVLLISTTEFPNVRGSFYDRNDLNYASVTYLIKSLDVLRHTDEQQCTASRSQTCTEPQYRRYAYNTISFPSHAKTFCGPVRSSFLYYRPIKRLLLDSIQCHELHGYLGQELYKWKSRECPNTIQHLFSSLSE
jgi:hypothetical protein